MSLEPHRHECPLPSVRFVRSTTENKAPSIERMERTQRSARAC